MMHGHMNVKYIIMNEKRGKNKPVTNTPNTIYAIYLHQFEALTLLQTFKVSHIYLH